MNRDGWATRSASAACCASFRVTEPARKRRDLSGALTVVTIAFVRPLVLRYSRRLAEQIFATDGKAYTERLDAVRARITGDTAPGVDLGQKPEP